MKVERLKERLRLRDVKLKSLLEISRSINNNLSTVDLVGEFQSVLEHQLSIPRAVLFTRIGEQWLCSMQYGLDFDLSGENVPERFEELADIKLLQSDVDGALRFFDIIIPVHHQNRPLAYLLIGDTDSEDFDVSPIIKHMRFIQTLANLITVAIENKSLAEKSLEQERIKTELDLAAEMQNLLIGSNKQRAFEHYDVASFYRPHMKIGGDFFDFVELENGDAFFCVADVSGKGVSAAFLMATLQSHLRALIMHTKWDLKSLVANLNRKIIDTVDGDRFVTIFLGHFDRSEGMLHYVNAGHNPPVFFDGSTSLLLEEGTVGVGMLKQLPFVNAGKVSVKSGDIVVCYTDGVVEIENEAGEEYGYEGVKEWAAQAYRDHIPMNDLLAGIITDLDRFRGKNDYFDDTALLCCKFR